jgi:hypothetical protein
VALRGTPRDYGAGEGACCGQAWVRTDKGKRQVLVLPQ